MNPNNSNSTPGAPEESPTPAQSVEDGAREHIVQAIATLGRGSDDVVIRLLAHAEHLILHPQKVFAPGSEMDLKYEMRWDGALIQRGESGILAAAAQANHGQIEAFPGKSLFDLLLSEHNAWRRWLVAKEQGSALREIIEALMASKRVAEAAQAQKDGDL